MNRLIQLLLIKIGDKVRGVDPQDFITQDTINWVWDIVKEVIKP